MGGNVVKTNKRNNYKDYNNFQKRNKVFVNKVKVDYSAQSKILALYLNPNDIPEQGLIIVSKKSVDYYSPVTGIKYSSLTYGRDTINNSAFNRKSGNILVLCLSSNNIYIYSVNKQFSLVEKINLIEKLSLKIDSNSFLTSICFKLNDTILFSYSYGDIIKYRFHQDPINITNNIEFNEDSYTVELKFQRIPNVFSKSNNHRLTTEPDEVDNLKNAKEKEKNYFNNALRHNNSDAIIAVSKNKTLLYTESDVSSNNNDSHLGSSNDNIIGLSGFNPNFTVNKNYKNYTHWKDKNKFSSNKSLDSNLRFTDVDLAVRGYLMLSNRFKILISIECKINIENRNQLDKINQYGRESVTNILGKINTLGCSEQLNELAESCVTNLVELYNLRTNSHYKRYCIVDGKIVKCAFSEDYNCLIILKKMLSKPKVFLENLEVIKEFEYDLDAEWILEIFDITKPPSGSISVNLSQCLNNTKENNNDSTWNMDKNYTSDNLEKNCERTSQNEFVVKECFTSMFLFSLPNYYRQFQKKSSKNLNQNTNLIDNTKEKFDDKKRKCSFIVKTSSKAFGIDLKNKLGNDNNYEIGKNFLYNNEEEKNIPSSKIRNPESFIRKDIILLGTSEGNIVVMEFPNISNCGKNIGRLIFI